MKNQVREINPQTRLLVNQISNSLYSKSYLTFILVLLTNIAFMTYCLSKVEHMSRQMEIIHDRLELNNAFVMKVSTRNEDLMKENKKLKEDN